MPRRARATAFKPIPLSFERGMWPTADAAVTPRGFARLVRNFEKAATSGWTLRPPVVYDGVADVQGLALWEDQTNEVTRLICIDDDGNVRAKDIGDGSSVPWGTAASSGLSDQRLTSFVTYNGVGYGCMDDGDLTPQSIFSYDGAALNTTPLSSSVTALVALIYKERMYLLRPRLTIDNLIPWNAAYTAAGGFWTLNNVAARNIAVGASMTGEIIPTTGSSAFLYRNADTLTGIAARERRIWRCDIHNTSNSYDVPMTLRAKIVAPWSAVTAYAANELVTPITSNGFRYRCIVAGTSGAAQPTFPTTISGTSTVVDGSVTWLCEATDVLGQEQVFVPSNLANPDYNTYFVEAICPPSPGSYIVQIHIIFGNDEEPVIAPTFQKVAVHMGYRDGLPDGDPRKKNYGQQVTAGDFYLPFFNVETDDAPTINVDAMMYSEVGDPSRFRASRMYAFGGEAGLSTAGAVFDGRIYAFKRRSFLPFVGVDSAAIVILPEGDERRGIGCVGPRAIVVMGNVLYWIAEDSVYALKAGANEQPRDILGDRMRSVIMDKGDDWLDSAAILIANDDAAVITCCTQAGRWFDYDVRSDAWSTHDVGGAIDEVTGRSIRAMIYNPSNGLRYASFASDGDVAGVARLDPDVEVADTIGPSTTFVRHGAIEFGAIEPVVPHMDTQIGLLRARQSATVSGTLSASAGVSFDGGDTFPASIAFTLSAVDDGGDFSPLEIPIRQVGGSLMPRLVYSGPGAVTVSHVEADVLPFRAHMATTATFGASSL